MKSFLVFPILFFLIHTAKVPVKKTSVEAEKFLCNTHILRSYMLKGRSKSKDTEKVITCPDVKHNCCTKYDQQRIYHYVNRALSKRMHQYNSKLKMSLTKIKRFHANISKTKFDFRGSLDRKLFCAKQTQRLFKFPLDTLYDKLTIEIDQMALENQEFHQKFFCIICDGKNHRFFEFEKKDPKMTMDLNFCKEHLKSRKLFLKMFNIDLLEYLMLLQNVVDCQHYSKSYDLKFYDESKIERSNTISECLNYLDTEFFFRYCKPICKSIQITKIHPEGEGDYDFLNDILTFMEKLFYIRENAGMPNAKVKSFMKKRLQKNNKKKDHRQLELNPPSHFEDTLTVSNKEIKKMKQQQLKRTIRTEKQRFSRNMIQFNSNQSKIVKDNINNPRLKKIKNSFYGINQRVLQDNDAEAKLSLIGKRILVDAPDSKKTTGNKSNKPKKKVEAKPYFDKQVFPFYEEIKVINKKEKKDKKNEMRIYQIETPPIDFDQTEKIYQLNLGINPDDYITLNFDIPREQFYEQLFVKIKTEKYDVDIGYLLKDFNQEFVDETLKDLQGEFEIESEFFEEPVPPEEEPGFFARLLIFLKKIWHLLFGWI